MRLGMRFGLSAIEKRDVWSRWKAGQSLHEIGRAFDKPHSCIRAVLLPRGGIPPAARRRSRLALTLAERENISRGIAAGCSIREIARGLDRAASSVCREVARHGGRPAYRAHEADHQAWTSALRPKLCLLGANHKLRDIVASKLILDWLPEQISGWLKNQYPNDERLRVSHETIYRSLFIQARGVWKKELMDHLRSKRRMRRSRHATVSGQSRGQIVDAISIRQRPAEAEDRAIFGHWEGDLLAGGKNSDIATLVERHSRFAMLIKVPSKETEAVVGALSQHVRKLRCAQTFADLGSRTGDGQAQGVYGGHECASLLLRSTKSLATRHQRKHQSAFAAILPARHGPVCLFASAARPGLAALEPTTQKNIGIRNSRE
jgi:IS30 family transposase